MNIKAVRLIALVAVVLVGLAGFTLASEPSTSGIEDGDVKAFVSSWLQLSQDNKNFDAVMGLYADTVDFYKLGRVKKDAVRADKRKYFDRWPQREHRLISLTARPGATDNEREVSLSFHYRAPHK